MDALQDGTITPNDIDNILYEIQETENKTNKDEEAVIKEEMMRKEEMKRIEEEKRKKELEEIERKRQEMEAEKRLEMEREEVRRRALHRDSYNDIKRERAKREKQRRKASIQMRRITEPNPGCYEPSNVAVTDKYEIIFIVISRYNQ